MLSILTFFCWVLPEFKVYKGLSNRAARVPQRPKIKFNYLHLHLIQCEDLSRPEDRFSFNEKLTSGSLLFGCKMDIKLIIKVTLTNTLSVYQLWLIIIYLKELTICLLKHSLRSWSEEQATGNECCIICDVTLMIFFILVLLL